MFAYIKRKLLHHKVKGTFQEYGTQVKEFNLPAYGTVRYAQCLNPSESQKIVSEDKVDFFRKFVKKGDFAIDVGSHSGDTTIPLALAVGKEGFVLGLEPNTLIYKILVQNAELNTDIMNIVPLCAAATEQDGDFYYNSSEATFNNGGISKTSKSRHGKYALPQKVKGIHLGNYLEAHYPDDLKRFSFIKIDTEGHDYNVILSLSAVIDKVKPTIVAECFKKLPKKTRYKLFDYLSAKGYTMYHISDFVAGCVVTKMTKRDMTKWRAYDFCALPAGKSI
jgi:FkbM family methyltransferase